MRLSSQGRFCLPITDSAVASLGPDTGGVMLVGEQLRLSRLLVASGVALVVERFDGAARRSIEILETSRSGQYGRVARDLADLDGEGAGGGGAGVAWWGGSIISHTWWGRSYLY